MTEVVYTFIFLTPLGTLFTPPPSVTSLCLHFFIPSGLGHQWTDQVICCDSQALNKALHLSDCSRFTVTVGYLYVHLNITPQ